MKKYLVKKTASIYKSASGNENNIHSSSFEKTFGPSYLLPIQMEILFVKFMKYRLERLSTEPMIFYAQEHIGNAELAENDLNCHILERISVF